MSEQNETLVRVEGVDKVFQRGTETIHVLNGLSLEVPQGDFLALMGDAVDNIPGVPGVGTPGGLGKAKPGDKMTVTFPISIRTVSDEKMGGKTFTYTVKGNTVIGVEPKGKYHSLYQRDKYRSDKAPWI